MGIVELMGIVVKEETPVVVWVVLEIVELKETVVELGIEVNH
jgi:hypothetical protein